MLADSYNIAREKLRRAEDTSTLETDHEEPSVRQRRKKHFTDTEDECDDSPCPASVSKKKPPKKISKTSLPLPVPPVSLHQSALVSRCDVSGKKNLGVNVFLQLSCPGLTLNNSIDMKVL